MLTARPLRFYGRKSTFICCCSFCLMCFLSLFCYWFFFVFFLFVCFFVLFLCCCCCCCLSEPFPLFPSLTLFRPKWVQVWEVSLRGSGRIRASGQNWKCWREVQRIYTNKLWFTGSWECYQCSCWFKEEGILLYQSQAAQAIHLNPFQMAADVCEFDILKRIFYFLFYFIFFF